ncbi:hypothetical protein PCH_Pc12g02610 [Penicillium rubens Wisconsin 54-1255]|uniref:Uncharacterized protein n=1 Tax=Penicillium rubens (strain ATCC 28089 / DSM 1075 / NRRL 1951 / Wisconsin 54-1255) TaxID=500485 RepID=B6H039_PENRW|nr:hypothetical protein PCH_Pc12g02610 [Penicillium rubens Wisconsin 54-1255]
MASCEMRVAFCLCFDGVVDCCKEYTWTDSSGTGENARMISPGTSTFQHLPRTEPRKGRTLTTLTTLKTKRQQMSRGRPREKDLKLVLLVLFFIFIPLASLSLDVL